MNWDSGILIYILKVGLPVSDFGHNNQYLWHNIFSAKTVIIIILFVKY